jgi:uncharacterized protein
MTWMLTSTGLEYHLSGPAALGANGRTVAIEDIAHHLSLINRFTGATSRPYSVAEHSLLCCEIAARAGASPIVQLAALMHDAHEAYVTDLSSPAKTAVNAYSMAGGGIPAWNLFENEHAKTVRAHFGLLTVFASHRGFIREVDFQALATERRDLTAYTAAKHSAWAVLGDAGPTPVPALHWVRLNTHERESRTWRDWRQAFHARFDQLRVAVESKRAQVNA